MTLFAILLLTLQSAEVPAAVTEARSLVESGRSLEALQVLEAASRELPQNPQVWNELGILYGAAGQARAAFSAFEKAVELAPDNKGYALAFGELLFRAGRAEQALPFLEKASSPPAPLPEGLVLLAAAQEKLGNASAMYDALTQYIVLEPEDSGIRRLLGDKLEQEKHFDEALAVYRDALATSPDEPLFLHRAAALLVRDREGHAEAEELVRRALTLRPDLLEARLLLARILERTDRTGEALHEIERAREADPDSPEVYYRLSQALQRAGRPDEARDAAARFQELSVAEKEREELEARVAVTYKEAAEALQRGDMVEAQSVFRSVLELDPEHAQTRSMLAKIAFSKGDVVGAIGEIERAIEHDPDIAEYHYLFALFLARSGGRADAEASLGRALELDPAFPDAWSLLGTLLLDSGRAEDAVDCFSRAAALEPDNAVAHLNLATAYAAAGEPDKERTAMERYRALSRRQ